MLAVKNREAKGMMTSTVTEFQTVRPLVRQKMSARTPKALSTTWWQDPFNPFWESLSGRLSGAFLCISRCSWIPKICVLGSFPMDFSHRVFFWRTRSLRTTLMASWSMRILKKRSKLGLTKAWCPIFAMKLVSIYDSIDRPGWPWPWVHWDPSWPWFGGQIPSNFSGWLYNFSTFFFPCLYTSTPLHLYT